MLGGRGRGVLTERGETDTSCCHDNSCNLRLQLVASKVLQRGGGGGEEDEEEGYKIQTYVNSMIVLES